MKYKRRTQPHLIYDKTKGDAHIITAKDNTKQIHRTKEQCFLVQYLTNLVSRTQTADQNSRQIHEPRTRKEFNETVVLYPD